MEKFFQIAPSNKSLVKNELFLSVPEQLPGTEKPSPHVFVADDVSFECKHYEATFGNSTKVIRENT
jgi:hypothetical protein